MAGYWSIIKPEATTNLVTNPSIEVDTTGYTAVGGSVNRVATDQRREVSCLQVTPTAGVNDGVYYGTVSLTSGQSYTFSVDIKGTDGEPYTIYFANTGGTEQGTSTDFTATGEWERQEVTWACTSTASYRLYVTKNNDNNTDVFYLDGWQCENKAYSTTYADGNQEGCEWTGAEHGSTSNRDAQSRVGGRVYNLDTYGFYVDEMPGIGMPPIQHQVQQQPLLPGAILRGTKVQPRIFELVSNQIGDSHEDLHSKRKDLLDVIKPDLVLSPQPFVLRYTGANAEITTEIRAVYDSGYQWGNLDGFTEHDLPLRFIAYEDPFFREVGNTATTLTTNGNVSNADYIISKVDGVWASLGTGANDDVFDIYMASDNTLYACGQFTSIGGTSANYIASWDGSSWSALGTGLNDDAYEIKEAANGDIYVVGKFTTAGGSSAPGIAYWNGSTWATLSTGLTGGATPQGRSMAFDHSGNLYVGGLFTTAGGTSANNIAKWDGSSFSALGTGTATNGGSNALIYEMALADDDTTLYICGGFHIAGGVTVHHVAKWDGSSWSALGTGADTAQYGYALDLAPDGRLYFGGSFTSVDSVAANYIACWNGTAWTALGDGVNGNVRFVSVGDDNTVYVSGYFTQAGGLTSADRIAKWNGSTWSGLDVDLPGDPTVWAMLPINNDLYLGYSTTGTATAAYTQTVTNSGTRSAYPIIKFKRSGGTTARLEWMKNETTGALLNFDYTLNDGEELSIDLSEGSRGVISSQFGKSWQAILRSSDIANFYLAPGDNDISVYVSETGSPTITASMEWRNTHWSADGVAP